jgi:hypothetical protein
MREAATFDLSTASVNLAEALIQTRMFDDEISSHALRNNPEIFAEPVLEEREVMMRAALRMAAPYREADMQRAGTPTEWWPSVRAMQEIQRGNAASLRLMGRQLTIMKNMERYADSRTPLPHMETAKSASTDLVSSLVRFLQSHHSNDPGEPEDTVYQLVRKEGVVYSSNEVHQDHAMAMLLREAGIGKPASDAYPAPLKALVVTPTANDTYRLAFRRTGNSIFQQVAPDVELMTTRRYAGLIKDQGGRVVVTHPQFLESAVLSGKMSNIQFDLVLTDNFSSEEAEDLHQLVHAQEVGPVIIDFAIGFPHRAPEIENSPAGEEHHE